MTRNMSHDELYLWLEQLKLKRSDSTVVRDGVVVGPHLATSLCPRGHERLGGLQGSAHDPGRGAGVRTRLHGSPGRRSNRLRRYLTELAARGRSASAETISWRWVQRRGRLWAAYWRY